MDVIFNSNDETIGYYSDLRKMLVEQVAEFVDKKDYEQATDMLDNLVELEKFGEYEGLLVLSNNNGMGFSVEKYRDDWELAQWVAENIAPESDDDIPKIFSDYDRQKDFMEQVREFMKSQ